MTSTNYYQMTDYHQENYDPGENHFASRAPYSESVELNVPQVQSQKPKTSKLMRLLTPSPDVYYEDESQEFHQNDFPEEQQSQEQVYCQDQRQIQAHYASQHQGQTLNSIHNLHHHQSQPQSYYNDQEEVENQIIYQSQNEEENEIIYESPQSDYQNEENEMMYQSQNEEENEIIYESPHSDYQNEEESQMIYLSPQSQMQQEYHIEYEIDSQVNYQNVHVQYQLQTQNQVPNQIRYQIQNQNQFPCQPRVFVPSQRQNELQPVNFQKSQPVNQIQEQKQLSMGDPVKKFQRSCAVCGGKGSGIYGGVFVCEGCKKIFRRGLSRPLQCSKKQNCDVRYTVPSKCQFCRFQKCLESGMVEEPAPMSSAKKEKEETAKMVSNLTSIHLSHCLLTEDKIEKLVPLEFNLNIQNIPNFSQSDAWAAYSHELCKDIKEFTFFVKKIPRLENFKQKEKAFMIKANMFSIYLLRNFRAISMEGLLFSDGHRINFDTLKLLYGNIADEMIDIAHRIRGTGVSDDDIGLFIILILTQVWRRNFARRDALKTVYKYYETLVRREISKKKYGNYIWTSLKELIPKLDSFNESCKFMIEELQPNLEKMGLSPLARELFGMDWSVEQVQMASTMNLSSIPEEN
uniref:Nuclear receptor domain-containing protein n=1 Tax=Caenorhabditis tropicalis TaxID=1561998 RepID=A0A1I7UFF7_9PELO